MAKEKKKQRTITDRVRAGIAFLNVVKPGWKKEIDLKRLDLSSGNTCMIGELYGDYDEGIITLGIENNTAEVLGFYESDASKYSKLTRAWKMALRKLGIK